MILIMENSSLAYLRIAKLLVISQICENHAIDLRPPGTLKLGD